MPSADKGAETEPSGTRFLRVPVFHIPQDPVT
jgi:hypothetical protein